jgi:hypothetical protein
MARKISNRSGSISRPGPDSPITPGYRAPGSNGQQPLDPRDASVGPQSGLTKVVSNPGDPNFEHDILVRQGLYHPTKQKQVQTHSAMDHHRQKHQRGAPGTASDVLDQATGSDLGAQRIGLDSAS